MASQWKSIYVVWRKPKSKCLQGGMGMSTRMIHRRRLDLGNGDSRCLRWGVGEKDVAQNRRTDFKLLWGVTRSQVSTPAHTTRRLCSQPGGRAAVYSVEKWKWKSSKFNTTRFRKRWTWDLFRKQKKKKISEILHPKEMSTLSDSQNTDFFLEKLASLEKRNADIDS